ncbi:hypothetical protein NMG60_11009146 [Bertholletia excelsa]
MEMEDGKKQSTTSWLAGCTNLCLPISPAASPSPASSDLLFSISTTTRRKPGGWKAMPFVLGNETFERLATFGLLANFMIFLLTEMHMEQAAAASLLNIWSGMTNFAPLAGAFISDAYVGRFWTIAFGSFASFLPPFGVDQFDPTTEEGRKGINSFFNWYYATFTVVLILALTVVVYVQDNVSWALGFGIPTAFMLGSIVLFFIGTRLYVYVKPEGSVFSGIARALVAAYHKRKVELPDIGEIHGAFYDPPLKGNIVKKLPFSNQFRFLNKAAIILDGDVNPDGSPSNPWRLSSIQQIEELKCLIKIIPVWASGIVCFTSIAQQATFTISQAQKMDRHLGSKFQIPPGSLVVISLITVGTWVPFYDRVLVPALRKVTKIEGGITLLQRIGIGIVFSILSMLVAGLVERMRRASAISHGRPDGLAPMSVLWLAPPLSLMGFAEAFNIIGQIEFYYKEFPESMSSVANSLFFVNAAGANYLSSMVIAIVHKTSGVHGRPDWLTNDINAGRVDFFYYVIAAMGVLNLVYFLAIARRYQYKGAVDDQEEKPQADVELNSITQ